MWRKILTAIAIGAAVSIVATTYVRAIVSSLNPPVAISVGEAPVDQVYNYDFKNNASTSQDNVDWPVNIILWYNADKNSVIGALSPAFFDPGPLDRHNMWLSLNDGAVFVWNGDWGRKNGSGITEPNDHFRQYAANGVNMYNDSLEKYVVATSHQDRVGVIPFWFGMSETAELNIATYAEGPGKEYIVERNALPFSNLEPQNPDGTFRVQDEDNGSKHVWYSDGNATKIKIFDYLGDTSMGQEQNPATYVIQVPVSIDGLRERLSPYGPVTKSLLNYRARVTYPYDKTDPLRPEGIEIKAVSDGDVPFVGIGSGINNQEHRTKFWSTGTVPTGGLPIKVARLSPVIIGSNQRAYTLERVFDSIYTYDGFSVSQPKVEVKSTYLRGDTDGDGAITITDSLYIAQYLAQERKLDTLRALNAASPRHDGDLGDKVLIHDAMFIGQFLSGFRDEWYNWSDSYSTGLATVPAGKVSVSVPMARLTPGTSVAVPVMVKGIPAGTAGLGAYDLKLEFDPKVVRVQGFSSDGRAFPKRAAMNIDNVKGVVYLNGFSAAIPGSTGDITLGLIQLVAVGKTGDATSLKVTVRTLSDSRGADIPATAFSGAVSLLGN